MSQEQAGAPGAGEGNSAGAEGAASPEAQAAALAAAQAAQGSEPLQLTPNAKPAAGEVSPVAYEKTGDPGLDMALDFVGRMGVSPDDPAMVEAEKGNFALLKAKLAALGSKATGYDAYLALAEQSYKGVQEKTKAKVAKDKQLISDAVGGEEQLTAVLEWAKANAEPHEVADVNAAFRTGGLVGKAMAMFLASQYNKALGTVVNPASAVDPNAGSGAAAGAAEVMTVVKFAEESQKLRNKYGDQFESKPEFKQLAAKRAQARRQGK